MRMKILVVIAGAVVLIVGCKKQEVKMGLEEAEETRLSGGSIPSEAGRKMSVEEGSKVKVQYTGRFPDGTVFDKSPENNPLAFTVGAGSIIPGFEKAVEGMRLNEEKQVTIGAQDAYGQRDEELIKEFPKSSFPADFVPQKGMVISLKNQESGVIMATIIDVLQDSVMVDLNHPLAGKDLIFDIKIVSIE